MSIVLQSKLQRVLYAAARQEVLQHYDADGACHASVDARYHGPTMTTLFEYYASIPVYPSPEATYHTLLTWRVYDDQTDEQVARMQVGLAGRPGQTLRLVEPLVTPLADEAAPAAWQDQLTAALARACDAFNQCPVFFVEHHVPVPNV